MWWDVLKEPITIGTTRIGLKPLPEDDDECCEIARKDYLVWWKSNWKKDDEEWWEYMAEKIRKLSCTEFMDFLKDYGGLPDTPNSALDYKRSAHYHLCTRLMEEWDKCEDR